MSGTEAVPTGRRSVLYFESVGEVRGRPVAAAAAACRRAVDSIVATFPGPWRMVVSAGDAQRDFALTLAREAGLDSEVADEAAAEWRETADGRLVLFATAERPAPPASLGGGAAIWTAVRATDGQRWESDRSGGWQPPPWLEETLSTAGTSLADPVEVIFAKTDELALATAPDTRRSGRTLVMIEAVCVVLPVIWLLRTPLDLPPMVAALAGLASPLLIVSFCWWLRWRSMGRLGSRARLVAEACRSLLATRHAPAQPVVSLFSVVPALRPLLQKWAAEPPAVTADWRDLYVRDRLDGQHAYYSRQRDRALAERVALTRWSTILMDVALAVGCAGMVVTLHPRSASWLNLFGGSYLDFALGMAGLALPLGLLVAQSLRLVGESTRRTARYTQQILQIENLRPQLAAAQGPEAAQLLHEAEDALLSEVLDWYFQAETTEDFYTIREQAAVVVPETARSRPSRRLQFLWTGLGRLGTAVGFLVRVTLGRLIWVVGTAAFVMMWLSFRQGETPEVASRLRELGRVLNPADGRPFAPQVAAARYGTLVVAHGMRDAWDKKAPGIEEHWMRGIFSRVRQRLGAEAPQMIALDWHEGATASSLYRVGAGDELSGFLADVGGVRPSGQATGDFFGARLARWVEEGVIRADQPIHLIGHSAGGFVVARAAHILVAMGFPRDQLHVTILDTPEPDEEIKQKLAGFARAEFYRTSELVQVGPMNPAMHFKVITPPAHLGLTGFAAAVKAHSWAHTWYRETIPIAQPGQDGFGRSPFCR